MATTPSKPEGSTPVPDPTILTTVQIDTAISNLREVLQAQIDGNVHAARARFEGMDKALQLLQVIFDKRPAETEKMVSHLEALQNEKFKSIQTQFNERDVRTEQTARDSKVAVDAALQAAKEAVGEQNKSSALAIAKSETATTKQIDQLGILIQTTATASNDKIEDMKERLTRIEGQDFGKQTAVTTQQTSNSSTVAIISAVTAALIGVGALIISLTKDGKDGTTKFIEVPQRSAPAVPRE